MQPLTIVQVTPHSWKTRHEVNEFVRGSSEELSACGHRVLIAAPAATRKAAREARSAIAAARQRPAALFKSDGPRLLEVGGRVALPRGPRPRPAPIAVDASRDLEVLLGSVPIDIVHVHEPFAPSLSSTALRHSNSLNVGTFHEPSERVLSTQVARPLVEIFFGRLDARTVTCSQTAELLERYFPGPYELIRPGADAKPRHSDREGGPLRILFCLEEERGALRLFLRALRRLPPDLDWEATVLTPSPSDTPLRIARPLRERIRLVGPAAGPPEDLIADADVLCAASGGPAPAPQLIRMALAGGAVPVVSRLPLYSELLGDGSLGLMFVPGDAETMAGQIARLGKDRELLAEMRKRAKGAVPAWSEVADRLEDVYRRIAARRHDPAGDGNVRRRIARRKLIDVDLHMHTDHSPDCATPVEVLLETARDRGLGAIAITDHNEVSGALEAREMAAGMDGLQVIVAEEVKTAEQGEVIGLFIKERIPRGMSMSETIAEIRRQGGLVYVPHPFDRLHSVPDYEHLLDIVEEIDILEVFNPRVALTAFNDEAERFARKYRIVPGAGSDSHVAQGLGSVRVRIRNFEGPQEFLEAMRDADIARKHKNLIYVQALKFLQTTGRPKAPKRKVADAQPVRGGKPRRPRSRQVAPSIPLRPTWQELMQARAGKGAAKRSSKMSGPVPATDDEIQEKYLERAIRELNQLTRELQECEHCPRGKLMPVLGSGHPQADILMVKYAATGAEIEEGVAFYGRAGNALVKSFKRLGIDPLVVYGTLCAKCPTSDPELAAEECVRRLVEEIAIVQPRIIVVMGPRALVTLNGLGIPLSRRIEELEGEIQAFTPTVDALYVPDIDASLDEEGAKQRFWRAFKMLGAWYDELPPY